MKQGMIQKFQNLVLRLIFFCTVEPSLGQFFPSFKKVNQIKLNHCALAMSEDAAFMMLESGDLYS